MEILLRVTKLFLPFPPSVNSLYDGGHKTSRRFKSARYKDWIKLADNELIHQVALPGAHTYRHEGLINVEYLFRRPDKRTRDLANFLKSVDDFLVDNRIIKDDSLIHCITARWVGPHEVERSGVSLTITDSWEKGW